MKLYTIILSAFFGSAVSAQQPVINVDFNKEVGDMKPVWAWFGYD
jgi:xylan 1,4-beta-xylosidase